MRGNDFMTGVKPFREMTAEEVMEKDPIYFYKETTCDLLLMSMVDGARGAPFGLYRKREAHPPLVIGNW